MWTKCGQTVDKKIKIWYKKIASINEESSTDIKNPGSNGIFY
jgi:hypothetical protein